MVPERTLRRLGFHDVLEAREAGEPPDAGAPRRGLAGPLGPELDHQHQGPERLPGLLGVPAASRWSSRWCGSSTRPGRGCRRATATVAGRPARTWATSRSRPSSPARGSAIRAPGRGEPTRRPTPDARPQRPIGARSRVRRGVGGELEELARHRRAAGHVGRYLRRLLRCGHGRLPALHRSGQRVPRRSLLPHHRVRRQPRRVAVQELVGDELGYERRRLDRVRREPDRQLRPVRAYATSTPTRGRNAACTTATCTRAATAHCIATWRSSARTARGSSTCGVRADPPGRGVRRPRSRRTPPSARL